MIPKKSSLLYKELSEEMDLPQDLIQNFIEFYYKEIRSSLTGLKYPRINVDGLGQFVVRSHAVRKAIPRLKKMLETHDTTTFNAYFNKKMLEEKVQALENIEKQIVSLEEKKEAIKKQKDEYTKKNMEGEKEDN
jgi:hypothetical protein